MPLRSEDYAQARARFRTRLTKREAAPDILRQQMGLVRQVVETLRIPIIEAPGFEADDIIATLATQARDQGDEVVAEVDHENRFSSQNTKLFHWSASRSR